MRPSQDPTGPPATVQRRCDDEGFAGNTGVTPAPRFCSACGASLTERYHLPEARERLVCDGCGRIQYRNPTVVGALIVERDGALLLLRRAQPPRAGTWVFPGGFVELGETVEAAALRECREETGVEAALGSLLGVYNRPGPGVVIVVYRAVHLAGEPHPTREASEARWFSRDAIPWSALAFDTTMAALRDWANLPPDPFPS